MHTLAVILARAGSKGLPDKCVLPLCGQPVIAYTIGHAQQARRVDAIVLTTDSVRAQEIGRSMGVQVVERPPELATDTARVDDAVRHAVLWYEKTAGRTVDAIVILYGNVPVRAPDAIDRCVEHLQRTGCDSVRTVVPVSKQHPDWLHRLEGDHMVQFRPNSIHRRQDLEPVYYHDGAVIAVARPSMFAPETAGDPHAFFGRDRRAVILREEDSVDIDTKSDFYRAEALLRAEPNQSESSETWPSFQIGRKLVGQPGFVYVIAEAGVNHDGEIALAKELILAAAEAGADAVKFQVFSADRLVTRQAPVAAYQQKAGQAPTQHAMLRRLELSHDQLGQLAQFARQRGIEFLATPFSVPDLQFLVSIGVAAIKLASPDIVNAPLLDAAACSGLPVIASTGAADMDEIAAAVQRLRRSGPGLLALLHCISSYPAPEDQVNLAAIGTLARAFECVSGFSDHTDSVAMGAYAAAAGARIVEKHLTLDRKRPGPDHGFSLEPKAMAEYVRHVRHASGLLGDGRLSATDAQRDVRMLSRASIVAARDIQAGEVLDRGMLTTKRPGTGISPMEIDRIVGRRAVRAIHADTTLTWDDVER